MLGPLEHYITMKNGIASTFRKRPRVARMAVKMMGPDLAGKKITLSRWMLKGPPETWGGQLEEYYKKEPVFALLGGITTGDWEPIHRFCEENQIPCLFPITDYPVISEKDWYTLYFSKGIYQEGEAAARYLNSLHDLLKDKTILQVVRDSRKGRVLSQGFLEAWAGFGHQAPQTLILKPGEELTPKTLQGAGDRKHPDVLLLWDDTGALPALESLAEEKDRPAMVFISWSCVGKSLLTLKEPARDFTYITYPYRVPQDDARYYEAYIRPLLKGKTLQGETRRIFEQAYSTSEILTRALIDMRGEYYRDFFFDTIGMMTDQDYPLFERLSFGPGQRYASKGCYIAQLGKGKDLQLVKKSDWVIH